MLKTLRNALKIQDIRKKIIFTFLMLIVVRIGCQLPTPGVNRDYFANWFASNTIDLGFLDAFTGGSFMSMSIFALNITPYITSSIIMQLLTIAIPKLEEMQKEGEDGRKKIAEITRYLTVGLSLLESAAMAIGFGNQGLLQSYNFMNCVVVIFTLTAGTAFLMWIGERITEKGVGNGISIVLLINIVSRIPSDVSGLISQFVTGASSVVFSIIGAIVIVAVIILMIVLVVLLQGAQRRIPVQYAKKVQGRKMVGGQSTHIPLKVNTAGVIPIIFASSMMQFPIVIASFFNVDQGSFGGKILKMLNHSHWLKPSEIQYSIGLIIYIALVIFFAYFYTSVTFNPIEVANNMKKQGGFVPGIRPGKPTSEYLTKIVNYVIFIGAAGLVIIAVTPTFFSGVFNASISFGGTSLIIIVGVVLETMKQIESQMLVRHYKGFLNE